MSHCPNCGTVIETGRGDRDKLRSYPQLQRYQALCREVYHHWPEDGFSVFHPKSERHMRKFLEWRAGHFTVTKTFRVQSVPADKLAALLTAVLATGDDEVTFFDVNADQITVMRADSVSYVELDHYAATKLFCEVDAVLESFGMNAAKLLHEAKLRGAA